MTIRVKRIYDDPAGSDGYRVLVDRLWPRGITKERAHLDEWAKEIAPSNELRKWFHQDRTKWAEFKWKYVAELKQHRESLIRLSQQARSGSLTLLFASADPEQNHAHVLAEVLKKLD